MNMFREDDAPNTNEAECFITINGNRYLAMMAKNFEANLSIKTKEVPALGKIIQGRKASGAEGKFKMTIYKCTEIFDNIVTDYKNTGRMARFDIQVTSEDKVTSIGRSTKIYKDCIIDGDILLSMFDAEGDFIEQSIEGYFSDYESPEKYKNPVGM